MMDSSGSMKQSDPRQLRKPAARLFISLLDREDRVSVVSFSSQAWPITFLTQLNSEKNINKALRATDRISHKGVYTNIYAALSKGIKLLEDSDQLNREPVIILMSDGQMDVGNSEKSAELKQQIIEELLPQLIEHNIKVYTIAFTEASDQELLQEIADATDGRYALAASDDVLHKVFSKIFEETKQPDMLPLFENKFVVDDSISEVTIIANKKSDNSQIYLQTPAGEKINSTFKSENIKWFVSSSFDMITLIKPQPGEWKILFSDDDNRAYIVTDIKLRTRFTFDQQSQQPEIIIKAWFEQNEETEANADLLHNISLELEIVNPDDTLETLPLPAADENGVFTIHYRPEMDGIYGASIIAKSRTFQRQQTFSFRNTLPEEPVTATDTADETNPANSTEQDTETENTEQDKQPEDDTDITKTLIYFAIVNIVLLFIGLNGFLMYRYFSSQKKQPEKTTEKTE